MQPSYFEFHNPAKILSGKTAVKNVPFEIKRLGASRPLVITDQGVVGAGLIDILKGAFKNTDVTIGAIFDKTPPDSSMKIVGEIADVFRQNDCDSLIAVGGGSPIDTAKGVNIIVSENTDDLMSYLGADVLEATLKPFIVIPTTSGTGSEVTAAAVIANTEKT